MAGMEQLEIHSKSFIVRWVKVDDGHTISWSVQPHKKSINFGIVKHPRTASGSIQPTPSQTPEEFPSHQPESSSDSARSRRSSVARNDSLSTAQDQLKGKGFISIQWYGKYEADKVAMGTYGVAAGQGGMYGLVFDNTFSKAISKTATFVLLTYPSNAPPNTMHNLQGPSGAMLSALSMVSKSPSPRLGATASDSMDSLHSHSIGLPVSRTTSVAGRGDGDGTSSAYQVGILMKRRRKRGQGYARRYFSLDFASCTLSYYYNRNSSALRGAIPLSLAAIAADERRREFSIDSGAEVWHLRAPNAKEFSEWTKALEAASKTARGGGAFDTTTLPQGLGLKIGISSVNINGVSQPNPDEEMEWEQVEALVSRIAGTRDAVRRLTKTTSSSSTTKSWGSLGLSSNTSLPPPEEKGDYFGPAEKRPFWKRKSSAGSPRMFGDRGSSSKLASTTLPASSPSSVTTITPNGSMPPPPKPHRRQSSREEGNIHDHCASLLKDLDSVLIDFSRLIANSKRRRTIIPKSAVSRHSMDSTSTGEFYDAEAGDANDSQLVMINRHSGDETPSTEDDDEFMTDSASISSTEEGIIHSPTVVSTSLFPSRPKSLAPLPVSVFIKRRQTVPAATVQPPSLISILRKNVGKDLSTISMPVSTNEPISLLQRQAEALEYAHLLDTAATNHSSAHRLLIVAAFAVSYFSGNRARERAIRKPFNPMLGETYELVRGTGETPGNFRFLAEKVSHRPVKVACQADSPLWSFSQSVIPSQKFWGKSAELITEGRVYLSLRLFDGTDECYSWNIATVFLKNVVMGEKYVEPVGTMTVLNETSGSKATIEFKSKGMFGGRAEDVIVETHAGDGTNTGLALSGTWTQSLRILENGKPGPEIWKVGKLVDGAEMRYGLSEFATQLNEVTDVEKGKCAVTDSRFRKDQRAAEVGDLAVAEEIKGILEEGQRERRRVLEEKGVEWVPRWFVKISGRDDRSGGEEVWGLKSGKDGYWEERSKGIWTGVEDVLNLNVGDLGKER